MHRESSVRDNEGRAVACVAVCVLHLLFALAFLSRPRVGSLAFPRSNAHSFRPERSDELRLSLILLPAAPSKARPHESWAADVVYLKHTEVAIPALAVPSIDDIDSAAPATPEASKPGERGIRCEVHVHQSPQGRVEAIDFGTCTGDTAWQRSLIQSLQRAAELITPRAGNPFPPVRTFNLDTASISPLVLAQELSIAEPIQPRGPLATSSSAR